MSTVKNIKKKKNNPEVYAIVGSKAIGPVFVLILCGLMVSTTSASRFEVFPCSFSSSFFILFSIMITSRREGGAGLFATRAFVCLFCTC